MKEELTLHGSIVVLLKKFIDHSLPAGSWGQLLAKTHLGHYSFELTKAYHFESIMSIIKAASETTGLSAEQLIERFGEYMVPHLFQWYRHYLQPEWKTYEILLKTEDVMHGAVRKLNSTAHPPVINVSKISDELLIINYLSKRKMSSLTVGIINGIAKYYGEQQRVMVEPMTNSDSENVQIKVHFARK